MQNLKLTKLQGSLLGFFQECPWAEVELDSTRSQETGRDIELSAICSIQRLIPFYTFVDKDRTV